MLGSNIVLDTTKSHLDRFSLSESSKVSCNFSFNVQTTKSRDVNPPISSAALIQKHFNFLRRLFQDFKEPFTKRHKLVHNGGFPKFEALH